jgi:paraquat-inducible protein B
MKKPASPQLIGLFVLGALALAVILVLTFGGGHYFTRAQKYVAYFQGSVNGLNVGAMVKLKGVPIGRVTDILVQYDLEHNRVLTPVIAEINLGKVMDLRENHPAAHAPTLQELIDRGLRARLSPQSLVTGQLYMDVNFYPERPVQLVGAANVGLPEIPTIPSGREEIEDTLQDALTEFRELPIKETFEATLRSVRHIEQLLAAPETRASIGNLNRTLEELRHLVNHVDGKVDGLARNLDGTVKDSHALMQTLNGRMAPLLAAMEKTLISATDTFAQAKGALAAVEDYGDRDSELNSALRDVSEAARSVKVLADTLERNPEALLYGRKGREEAR